MIISRWIILRMGNVFQTKVVEKMKAHILCSITLSENCALYGIMWTNIVQANRPQMIIRRMNSLCWITKVTDTHSEHVIALLSYGKTLYVNVMLYVHCPFFFFYKYQDFNANWITGTFQCYLLLSPSNHMHNYYLLLTDTKAYIPKEQMALEINDSSLRHVNAYRRFGEDWFFHVQH
jgi:hypothetical protein